MFGNYSKKKKKKKSPYFPRIRCGDNIGDGICRTLLLAPSLSLSKPGPDISKPKTRNENICKYVKNAEKCCLPTAAAAAATATAQKLRQIELPKCVGQVCVSREVEICVCVFLCVFVCVGAEPWPQPERITLGWTRAVADMVGNCIMQLLPY